jgi:hypothetical protein
LVPGIINPLLAEKTSKQVILWQDVKITVSTKSIKTDRKHNNFHHRLFNTKDLSISVFNANFILLGAVSACLCINDDLYCIRFFG